jgi:hypothetical protein
LKQEEAGLHGYEDAFSNYSGISAFFSWEAVSAVKVIIWNKERLMVFEM